MQNPKNQNRSIPETKDDFSNSIKMLAAMGIVGLAAAVFIVFTFQITLPYIKLNEARFLEQAIFEVVPKAVQKTVFVVNTGKALEKLETEDEKAFKYYACYSENNELVGVALQAQGQGFQDVIKIIYGYSPQKQAIVGMKVLQSTETPGLGDKIEKDAGFIANFNELEVKLNNEQTALRQSIELVKSGKKTQKWQISAITGATISSKAIAKIIGESAKKNIPLIVNNLSQMKGNQ